MHSPTPSSFFPFSPFESQTLKTRTLKKQEQDVPCGPLAKNLPVNAGDTGSIPGLGRSLTPWGNGAREPQLLKSVHPGVHLCRKRRGHSEQPACQGRAAPARRSQRKPPHTNKDPVQLKINKYFFKKPRFIIRN